MRKIEYKTHGTCSQKIEFLLDDENRIHELKFTRGCDGNLKGIGRLCENREAKEVADALRGTTCGWKNTSCPDQLSKAIDEALSAN